jgi:nitrogen fixation/metabolism regulation signal transduction histidine kinase
MLQTFKPFVCMIFRTLQCSLNQILNQFFNRLQHYFLYSPKLVKVALVLAVAGILLAIISLATATGNDPTWTQRYTTLLWLNVSIIVILFILVLSLLSRLLLRLKRERFGARLTLRFASALALLGLVPGVLVYIISVFFLSQSIDSGFNTQVSIALNTGLELSRNILSERLSKLLDDTRTAAYSFKLNQDLGEQIYKLKASYMTAETVDILVFDTQGTVLASTGNWLSKGLLTDIPQGDSWRDLIRTGQWSYIESIPSNMHSALLEDNSVESDTLLLRAVVRVPVTYQQIMAGVSPTVYLQLIQSVSPNLSNMTQAVAQGVKNYELIKLGRTGLRMIYATTLTIILLLVVLAAVAMGFVLADAMNAPLLRLARGTQAVASGDFTPLSEPSGKGDLAVLTRSFNQMLTDLGSARTALTQNYEYLQQILSSLTTGVLVLDSQGILRSINPSAQIILSLNTPQLNNYAAQQLPIAVWQAIVNKQDKPQWQSQIEHISVSGETQTLLLRAVPLIQADGTDLLLVFDDVSATMLAQKAQAWTEVAQRLAHEIKNPLTPIQLSAERLTMKLADKLQGSDADLLKRSTAIIITQVAALKNMVDEFKQYARLPKAQLSPLDLDLFLREQLILYKDKVQYEKKLSSTVNNTVNNILIMADINQLRQVLHNLLGNALDAAQERCKLFEGLQVSSLVQVLIQDENNTVILKINDNGLGFSPTSLAKLFEPYHTTKAEGTGLGLAIVYRIVQEHHAKISVKNRLNFQNNTVEGAQVKIIFPKI